MTEAEIRSQLNKTRRFEDRQKLLKELWKIERAAVTKRCQETAHKVPRAARV